MKTKILLSFFSLLLFVGCGTQTKVTGVWKSDEYKAEDFSKIAVIAITSNIKDRDLVEDALVKKLNEIGYKAIPGSILLSPEMIKLKDKKVLESTLKKDSVDGALVISLLDVKEETYYVEGTNNYYSPRPYYGSFYNYYYYNYDRVYSPGYYATSTQIYLESNFYSLNSNTLAQTIQTETVDPADVKDLAESYSKIIIQQLVTGRVLKNKALIEKRKAKEHK